MAILPASVLYACNRNAVRSPMAEAITKHLFGQRIYVDSVGVRPLPVNGFAIAVLAEIGMNLANHRPKSFDNLHDGSFDLVISLTPEAQHRAVEMTRTTACEVEYWATFDPTITRGNRETVLQSFRNVRDDLLARIKKRFDTGSTVVV